MDRSATIPSTPVPAPSAARSPAAPPRIGGRMDNDNGIAPSASCASGLLAADHHATSTISHGKHLFPTPPHAPCYDAAPGRDPGYDTYTLRPILNPTPRSHHSPGTANQYMPSTNVPPTPSSAYPPNNRSTYTFPPYAAQLPKGSLIRPFDLRPQPPAGYPPSYTANMLATFPSPPIHHRPDDQPQQMPPPDEPSDPEEPEESIPDSDYDDPPPPYRRHQGSYASSGRGRGQQQYQSSGHLAATATATADRIERRHNDDQRLRRDILRSTSSYSRWDLTDRDAFDAYMLLTLRPLINECYFSTVFDGRPNSEPGEDPVDYQCRVKSWDKVNSFLFDVLLKTLDIAKSGPAIADITSRFINHNDMGNGLGLYYYIKSRAEQTSDARQRKLMSEWRRIHEKPVPILSLIHI